MRSSLVQRGERRKRRSAIHKIEEVKRMRSTLHLFIFTPGANNRKQNFFCLILSPLILSPRYVQESYTLGTFLLTKYLSTCQPLHLVKGKCVVLPLWSMQLFWVDRQATRLVSWLGGCKYSVNENEMTFLLHIHCTAQPTGFVGFHTVTVSEQSCRVNKAHANENHPKQSSSYKFCSRK